MFKFILYDDIEVFKNIITVLSEIHDEVFLVVTDFGLRIKTLDRSHITFIQIHLEKHFFNNIISEGLDEDLVAVDTEELKKIIDTAQPDEMLIFEKLNGEDHLSIIIDGETRRKFKLKTIQELVYRDVDTPEMRGIRAEIEIPYFILNDAITSIKKFSDRAVFSMDQDKFIISMENELEEGGIEWLHGEPTLKNLEKTLTSIHSLKHVSRFLKAEISETLFLDIGNDAPLKMMSKMVNGEVLFLVAPRIEGY